MDAFPTVKTRRVTSATMLPAVNPDDGLPKRTGDGACVGVCCGMPLGEARVRSKYTAVRKGEKTRQRAFPHDKQRQSQADRIRAEVGGLSARCVLAHGWVSV